MFCLRGEEEILGGIGGKLYIVGVDNKAVDEITRIHGS